MIPSVLQQHPPLFYPNIFSDSSHGTSPNPVYYFLHHTKQFARGVISWYLVWRIHTVYIIYIYIYIYSIHKNNFSPFYFFPFYVYIDLFALRPVHLILFECTGVISSAGALLASSTWVPRMVPCDR